jgi:hypothetical protein
MPVAAAPPAGAVVPALPNVPPAPPAALTDADDIDVPSNQVLPPLDPAVAIAPPAPLTPTEKLAVPPGVKTILFALEYAPPAPPLPPPLPVPDCPPPPPPPAPITSTKLFDESQSSGTVHGLVFAVVKNIILVVLVTTGQLLPFLALYCSRKFHTPFAEDVVGSFGFPIIPPLPIR